MNSKNLQLSKRYAHALWSLREGKSEQSVKLWLEKFKEYLACFERSDELVKLNQNPVFSVEQKEKVFVALAQKIFDDKLSVNFIRKLSLADRMAYLAQIVDELNEYFKKANNTLLAKIETAFELSEEQQTKIKESLEKRYAPSKIVYELKTNDELIAGLRVSVEGESLDNSLLSNIEKLKEKVMQEQLSS